MIDALKNLKTGAGIIVFALGFLAVMLAFVGFHISDLYETAYHEHATAARIAAMESEFKDRCSSVTDEVLLRDCFQSVLNQDWDTQRSQENLKVQKDVAKYTKWTTYIAAFSLILTVAGIGLVYVDVREARTSNYRQLRAYVSVSAKAVDMRQGGACEIQVEIKNTGLTPAYRISTLSTANIVAADANLPTFNQTTGQPYAILGSQCVLEEVSSVPIRDSDLTAIRAGHKIVFVSGRVEYSDASNQPKHTDYCYIYDGSRDGKMRPNANRYNEAT